MIEHVTFIQRVLAHLLAPGAPSTFPRLHPHSHPRFRLRLSLRLSPLDDNVIIYSDWYSRHVLNNVLPETSIAYSRSTRYPLPPSCPRAASYILLPIPIQIHEIPIPKPETTPTLVFGIISFFSFFYVGFPRILVLYEYVFHHSWK